MKMDLQIMNMAAASSTSIHIPPQGENDVFLSFRGTDTRKKFTSHLYAALIQRKIDAYIDNNLKSGGEIGPALLTAIEQSKLSVIIFSKQYASSTWCLDELVHILRCRQQHGQYVIPVFVGIDPSDVQNQSGSYADAFKRFEIRFQDNLNKVRRWRDALSNAANISGLHSKSFSSEAKFVETIVKEILKKLNGESSDNLKGLIGIEKRIQQVESLLCIPTDVDCRTVVLWGMGGIGKTTIADAIYHQLSPQFESCLFIANFKQTLEEHGMHHLRTEVLFGLMKCRLTWPQEIPPLHVRVRLACKKVLLVLDDVDYPHQVLDLIGFGDTSLEFGGSGSRIIITTRNGRLFANKFPDINMYEVERLNFDDALQLFHLNACSSSSTEYPNLSKKIVDHAQGNPSTLKALGSSFLQCTDKDALEDGLTRVNEYFAKLTEDHNQGSIRRVLREVSEEPGADP